MRNLVVGSGPSGVAVSTALLARGHQVAMIDAGKQLAAFNDGLLARLSGSEPSHWTPQDRALWQQAQFDAPKGQVHRYGSGAAMEPGAHTFTDPSVTDLRESKAQSGLSMLWGGAFEPYKGKDFDGWPITEDDLRPFDQAVAAIVPNTTSPLDHPSDQIHRLLMRATKAGKESFSAARVAVGADCRGCGMCLHGCPWGQIWQAGQQLEKLRQNPDFTYQSGPEVVAFDENESGVTLTLAGGQKVDGDKVFLATGVLPTARLLLDRGRWQGLTLRDSQFSFVPMLHRWRNKMPTEDAPFTTLPQVFWQNGCGGTDRQVAHAQLYGWNEYFARDLIANYAHKLPGSGPLWHWLARRLIVAQIFLHSDVGAKIELRKSGDLLKATAVENDRFDSEMKAVTKDLAKDGAAIGLHALGFAARRAKPGASFHVGASLPMSSNPSANQSDLLGRPNGFSKVHIVDATTLPSIPARTITRTVMANAFRIGTLA